MTPMQPWSHFFSSAIDEAPATHPIPKTFARAFTPDNKTLTGRERLFHNVAHEFWLDNKLARDVAVEFWRRVLETPVKKVDDAANHAFLMSFVRKP